jgi:hypothetical protein
METEPTDCICTFDRPLYNGISIVQFGGITEMADAYRAFDVMAMQARKILRPAFLFLFIASLTFGMVAQFYPMSVASADECIFAAPLGVGYAANTQDLLPGASAEPLGTPRPQDLAIYPLWFSDRDFSIFFLPWWLLFSLTAISPLLWLRDYCGSSENVFHRWRRSLGRWRRAHS